MPHEHPGSAPRIGIFGHYGNRNLGDEAIVEAVVQALPRHAPGVDLVAFSMDPADSAERYGIPAFPVRASARSGPSVPGSRPEIVTSAPMIEPAGNGEETVHRPPEAGVRRALARVPGARAGVHALRASLRGVADLREEWRFLRRARGWLADLDLLMITGSNQFLDNFGGPWGYPYTLLKWRILARLTGVPVAFVSVGAGPIDRRLSRIMARLALRGARYVSYRDAASRALIERGISRGQGIVAPDLAHLLDPALVHARAPRHSLEPPLHVAINPMPVYDRRYWPDVSDRLYGAYVDALAGAVERFRTDGHRLTLYGTQPSDERVIRDILGRLGLADEDVAHAAGIEVRRSRVLEDLVSVIHSADVVVATRFHGTLLALACRRPVLAICYYRKTRDLMRESGLEHYALTLEDITADDVQRGVNDLAANHAEVLARIDRTDRAYRDVLARQFDTLLASIRPRPDDSLSTGREETRPWNSTT